MNDVNEVKLHFLDYWRVMKVRSGIILLTFLLVMITAGITTYFLPRQYFSKVTMEVKPDDTGVKIFSPNDTLRGTSDLRFAPTQFQIIQKKEILYPVIENLKLQEKWAIGGQKLPKEQAYYKLLKMMDVREVRNTDLIEIGVYSVDTQEAADVANSIAVVYQEKRRTDQKGMLDRGLSQLQEEVNKQREKVELASKEAAEIRTRENIIDLNPETVETVESAETRKVLEDEKEANQARIKVAEIKTQLDQVEKLKPGELMIALHTLGIEDPTVSKVLPLYQDAVAEEARMLNSGLGENHPRVRALRAQKEVYTKQLSDQLSAMRNAQATKLKVAQETLGALESKLKGSQGEQQVAKTLSAMYIEAKNKYIQAKKVLEAAETRLVTETMQGGISFTSAKIWEKAEPSAIPAKPNVPAYMALAVLTGLLCGIGLAFFMEYLDTSVKTLDDVEKFLGIPVLAVIPKNITILINDAADSPDAEAYRILRTNMEFNRKNPDANTITLISGGPGEGKSTTLCNLAYTCAKGGYNVLIVDADLRRPSQHRFFNVDNSVGLTNYLTSNMDFQEVVRPTAVENLSFMPSGVLPMDAVGILNSQRMSDLISQVKRRYDLIFFDSPPILGVSDGSVLASEVDITIMVVQHRRFPRSMLQRVKMAVSSVGGNLLGVVLNNVDTRHDQGYQYYTSYYDYYSVKPETQKPEAVKVPAARNRASSPHEDY
jgi:capsular exopolysaccharide synthesis family protein